METLSNMRFICMILFKLVFITGAHERPFHELLIITADNNEILKQRQFTFTLN